MDKIDINKIAELEQNADSDFEFEVEDVTDLDIFAPAITMCSSTTSSSSCCG